MYVYIFVYNINNIVYYNINNNHVNTMMLRAFSFRLTMSLILRARITFLRLARVIDQIRNARYE